MQFAQGDMWLVYYQVDLFLITTNGVVTKSGKLVMGAGIARQARDRFPGVDQALGAAVKAVGSPYGLLVSPRWSISQGGSGAKAKLGAFQTKDNWTEGWSLALIGFAADKLLAWCEAHPTARVHLNMPGVGHGGLSREVVLPLLTSLPDTVTVWEYRRP